MEMESHGSAPADARAPARPELVCIGLATLDTIVALPGWPEQEGRLLADALEQAGGGPAATAAVTAAKLGRSVAVVGCVGQDAAGAAVRQGLREAGVDVSQLADGPGRTAQSVILVQRTAGTRAILHAPGPRPAALSSAAREACTTAAWVHVDHDGWRLAADAGLPRERVSVDAGNLVEGLELAGLGLYAPSAAGLARRYPGVRLEQAVALALDEGARRVVVTMGEGGALAAEPGAAWRVAGAPSADAVSTLGAGDVFHGALLAALIEGRTLPDALRCANLAAALSCRALDGRSGIPSRAELETALPNSPPVQPVSLAGEA